MDRAEAEAEIKKLDNDLERLKEKKEKLFIKLSDVENKINKIFKRINDLQSYLKVREGD